MPKEQTSLSAMCRPSWEKVYQQARRNPDLTHAQAVMQLLPEQWTNLRLLSRPDFKTKTLKPIAARLRSAAEEGVLMEPSPIVMFDTLRLLRRPSKIKAVVCCSMVGGETEDGIPYNNSKNIRAILRALENADIIAESEAHTGDAQLTSWIENNILILPTLWTKDAGESEFPS